MSEIRVTSVVGESGGDRVGLTTGLTVGPLTGTTGIGATITHQGHAQFAGVCTATSFVPTVGQLSHRNLVINGAMMVAQRGTSSTSTGYGSVDRFSCYHANTGVTITQSQQSTIGSDTPYTLGFRKFFRIALGGAGTANANAEIGLTSHLEAQDVANSGWNHTSSTSNITLSFWFRCSTNQTFYAYLRSRDGTNQNYPFSFTASGNNAWTKITKTIPGNSNVQIDNNVERGLSINFIPFYGTDLTNNLSVDQWSAYDTANRMPDMASTWLTAGASTFDVTGVQLEVGPVATPFEHRRWNEEYLDCCRYYQSTIYVQSGNTYNVCATRAIGSTVLQMSNVGFKTMMRSTPSIILYNGTEANKIRSSGGGNITLNSPTIGGVPHGINYLSVSSGLTNAEWYQFNYTADAEL